MLSLLSVLIALHLPPLTTTQSTPTKDEQPTIPPKTIQCYQCYVHKGADQIRVYHNSSQLITWQTSGISLNVTADYLEKCPTVSCTRSCVLATNKVEISLPPGLAYPTARPWYATTATPPSKNKNAKPAKMVELEYRTCASPEFDLCSSFQELNSEGCKQQACSKDQCNKDFKDKARLIIIIVCASISLLVCIGIVVFLFCWYFKIRSRKGKEYRKVGRSRRSIRESIMVRFRVGFVRREVVRIEERTERSDSGSSKTKSKDDKGIEKTKDKEKLVEIGFHIGKRKPKDKDGKVKDKREAKNKEGKGENSDKSKDNDRGKDKNTKSIAKEKAAKSEGGDEKKSKSKDKIKDKSKR